MSLATSCGRHSRQARHQFTTRLFRFTQSKYIKDRKAVIHNTNLVPDIARQATVADGTLPKPQKAAEGELLNFSNFLRCSVFWLFLSDRRRCTFTTFLSKTITYLKDEQRDLPSKSNERDYMQKLLRFNGGERCDMVCHCGGEACGVVAAGL